MFWEKVRSSKSKIFIFCLFNFVAGVAIASAVNLGWKSFVFIIIVLTFFGGGLILNKQQKYRLIFLGGIFVCLGVLRFIITEPRNISDNLTFYHNRSVNIKAVIASESVPKNGNQTFFVKAKELKISNLEKSFWQKVIGNIYLSLPLYPAYHYGEYINLDCDLVAPGGDLDASKNFANYLKKEGIWSICLQPKIYSSGEYSGNVWQSLLYKIRFVLNAQINRLLSEPQASFLAGLLYGARTTLSDELTQAFNRTGTTHIIAISGYNITIIAATLAIILRFLGLPRKKSFWLITIGIIFFVFFTGASASVVRAGIMGLVVLLSKQFGRGNVGGRVLILAVFLMLLVNPRLLFFDVGFQLSFLSTIGLMYVGPILEKYFYFWPERFGLKEIILSTLSAIIATAPLTIYVFGRFSLVAPVANLLILWSIPYVMSLGAIAIGVSFIFFPLGQILAWLTWLPLTYIIKVVEILAKFKWASLEIPKVVLLLLLLFYALLIQKIFKYNKTV